MKTQGKQRFSGGKKWEEERVMARNELTETQYITF